MLFVLFCLLLYTHLLLSVLTTECVVQSVQFLFSETKTSYFTADSNNNHLYKKLLSKEPTVLGRGHPSATSEYFQNVLTHWDKTNMACNIKKWLFR